MAKLPSIKKILREDLKDAPAWVDKLIYVLNRFMEEVYGALNRDLTFTENIASAIKTVSLTTRKNYPEFDMIKISNPLKIPPQGVLLMRAVNANDNSPIKNPIGIDWDFLDGNIRILHISGLVKDTKYQLTLLVI